MEMKLAAVRAIADLAMQPVPESVMMAYNEKNLSFGPQYIIPKPMDPRLLTTVAPAVAKAAMESGVAKFPIVDWEGYHAELRKRLGIDNDFVNRLMTKAKTNPKRVVFAEADHIRILRAAEMAKRDGICEPILLGNPEAIQKMMDENTRKTMGDMARKRALNLFPSSRIVKAQLDYYQSLIHKHKNA